VTWLHGGLQGAVTENRFNQIGGYVNQNYLADPRNSTLNIAMAAAAASALMLS
jgi:hypothetical protein